MPSERICQQIQRYLPQYVRGELGPTEEKRWADHLASCSACRWEEKRERQLQTLSETRPSPAFPESPELAERVREGVQRRLRVRRRLRGLAWGGALAMGMGLLLVVGLGKPGSVGGWPSYQRLAQRVEREFLGARPAAPVRSYDQLESVSFKDPFYDYNLSQGQRRRYGEAIGRLEGQLRRRSGGAEEWVLLGTLQLGVKQTQQGKQSLQRALDLNPALAGVYQQLSEVYRREGRLEEALRAADRAVERAPEEAYVYCQRAAVRADRRDFEGALQDLQRAEVWDPGAPEIGVGRGMIYLETGREGEAVEAFRRALRNDPGYSRARVMLGLTYVLKGEVGAAEAEAKGVLREDPEYPLAHLLLGGIYEGRGERGAAIEAYRRVLEADPEQEYAAYRLGRQYAILGSAEGAVATFGDLVRAAPGVSMLHYQLGLGYQRMGRYEEAVREFRVAQRQEPGGTYAPLALAEALYGMGQREEAYGVLVGVAERFPGEWQVYELLYKHLRGGGVRGGEHYGRARAILQGQRGERAGRFLGVVEGLARGAGVWEGAKGLIGEGRRLLEAGDVVGAEGCGMEVCERYGLGLWVELGPKNRGRGLRQMELGDRDGGTRAVADLGGRSARWTRVDDLQRYLYFDVAGQVAGTHEAWVVVEYWDTPGDRLALQYDSTDEASWMGGRYKWTENVWKGGRERWERYVFWLPDAAFSGRQHGGADFRIHSRGWRDTAVHSVRVLMLPDRKGSKPAKG
jgi:tetratricopeptide (TPR) repeat protein